MNLQPRKYTYKNLFNMRFRRNIVTPSLLYGDVGLALSHPLQLTANRLGNINLRLNNANRRRTTTHRRFWLRSFPHLPLTRNSTNASMGNGRGKLNTWFSMLYGGTILLEFRNLRSGRAYVFLNNFRGGLRSSDFIIFRQPSFLAFPLKRGLTNQILPFH